MLDEPTLKETKRIILEERVDALCEDRNRVLSVCQTPFRFGASAVSNKYHE